MVGGGEARRQTEIGENRKIKRSKSKHVVRQRDRNRQKKRERRD